MTSPLPSFERPPVVETVLAVQFEPLNKWTIAHFGLLWLELRDEFPHFDVQPALASSMEDFGPPRAAEPRIELMKVPDVRCWYTTEDNRELIQVQNNRFVYNWRKGDSDADYPRYEKFVRPRFEKCWRRFEKFLIDAAVGMPEIVQCEVTYVNHITYSEELNGVSDWHKVLRIALPPHHFSFLPAPETVRLVYAFPMPDRKGRLHVTCNSAIRNKDAVPIIHLQLTARGKPDAADFQRAISWLDLGREWIVRGFADLTTERMHQLWNREQ